MFVIFVMNKHLLGHFFKHTLFSSASPLDPYIVNNEYLLIYRMYLFNCKQNDHREINSIDIVQIYLNKSCAKAIHSTTSMFLSIIAPSYMTSSSKLTKL